MQGLVVEQDLDDLLRVGVHRDGAGVRLFVASMVTAPPRRSTTRRCRAARRRSCGSSAAATRGRSALRRRDDWTTAAVFTHAMTVRTIGPFAGNGGLTPSGYTAAVDHFRVIPPDMTPPVITRSRPRRRRSARR